MKLFGTMFICASSVIGQLPSCFSTTQPGRTVTAREGFETDLSLWTQGADVPEDPNNPGNPVTWSIDVSKDRAFQGLQSAKLMIDGRQDDGTIWIAREFNVTPDTDYRANISVEFWSESESFNTLAKVAAFAGPDAPTAEAEFDTTQAANLSEGWRTYLYHLNTHSTVNGKLWVAVGISAVWETELTYYLDNLDIELMPR